MKELFPSIAIPRRSLSTRRYVGVEIFSPSNKYSPLGSDRRREAAAAASPRGERAPGAEVQRAGAARGTLIPWPRPRGPSPRPSCQLDIGPAAPPLVSCHRRSTDPTPEPRMAQSRGSDRRTPPRPRAHARLGSPA